MTRFARSVAFSTALALTLGLTVPALAKEVDVDLKDGSTYSGTLVERVPGDHVTIKLATGEVKRFEWDEIAEQETPKPKVKAKPEPTANDDEGTYNVTIETEQEGVVLERMVGTTTLGNAEAQHWERVCSAPCNRAVRGGEYRIGGIGLRKTDLFTIDRGTTIQAKVGKQAPFWVGIGLMASGATLGLTGLAILSTTSTSTPQKDSFGNTYDDGSDAGRNASWAIFGLGGVMLTIGVVLAIANANDVRVNDKVVAKTKSTVRFTGNGFVF